MIRIAADHKIPFLKGALEDVAQVDYLPGESISRKDLIGTDALITRTRTRCDRLLLEGTGVRFIASATIGHDHIDAAYCKEAGIGWTNAPGCNSGSVRQYMVSVLLWLANTQKTALSGTTLGVVGVGNVGSKVAEAAGALGMNVLLNDPPRERKEGKGAFVSLETLLEASHVVSLHVPLNREGTDKTWHLAGPAFMERMKKGAWLVNTSRGGVVDEKAMLKALGQGRLSGAILDVFEDEPQLDAELLEAVTLATPHIAGYSLDGKANGTMMAVRAVSRFFGLGLDHWQPDGIPGPEQPQLLGDASEEPQEKLLWDVYRQTYDVTRDDRKLRDQPHAFEALRGDYPFRREPEAYSVKLFQAYPEINTLFEALGFAVLEDQCF